MWYINSTKKPSPIFVKLDKEPRELRVTAKAFVNYLIINNFGLPETPQLIKTLCDQHVCENRLNWEKLLVQNSDKESSKTLKKENFYKKFDATVAKCAKELAIVERGSLAITAYTRPVLIQNDNGPKNKELHRQKNSYHQLYESHKKLWQTAHDIVWKQPEDTNFKQSH